VNFLQIIVLQLNVEFILHVEDHFQKLHRIELHVLYQIDPVNGLTQFDQEMLLENPLNSGDDRILHLDVWFVVLLNTIVSCYSQIAKV
jgi:hypothetical protein